MQRTILIIGLVLLLVVSSGCVGEEAPAEITETETVSKEPQRDIIGRWQSADKSLTLEFTAEGKLIAHSEEGGIQVDTEADTVFISDNLLLGMWERNLPIYEVHIYGDRMTLKEENGKEIKFNRIK